MYKKCSLLLMLANLVFLSGAGCLGLTRYSYYASKPAFQIALRESVKETSVKDASGMSDASSDQRVINYRILEKEPEYDLGESEFQILCRIVEAEAGCEDLDGRILVANVILNRVRHPSFPDSVQAVVFQESNGTYQFSPIRDGRYNRVRVSETTMEAVQKALMGEDHSEGALYFASRKAAASGKMRWFDTHLTRILIHGGHEFFL